MCRMIAVTTTNIDPKTLFTIVDRGLLASLADDKGQVDGYGIATSDSILVKGAGSYRDAEMWFTPSKMKTPMIGHIRAASSSTGKTDKEAHPYFFEKAAVPFLLQHNGNVASSFGIASAPYPATDSYAAGQELEKLVNAQQQLNASVLLEWAQDIKETNPFVFFILAQDTLYILRGNKERTMYYLKYGDGFIFHTNPYSLLNIVSYCLQLGITSFEPQKIQEVPEKTLYVVRGGTIEEHKLTLAKDERSVIYVYGGTWTENSWYKPAKKPEQTPSFFLPKMEEAEEVKVLTTIFELMAYLEFYPSITLISFIYTIDKNTELKTLFELEPEALATVIDNIKRWNKVVRRDIEYDFLTWVYREYQDYVEYIVPLYYYFSEKTLQEVYEDFLQEQYGGKKQEKKENVAEKAAENAADSERSEE